VAFRDKKMSVLDELNWVEVKEQYDVRMGVRARLDRHFSATDYRNFFDLALGISDSAGNYSAVEHNLGPQVRAANPDSDQQVSRLAGSFRQLSSAREVPELIRNAQIRYLSIGVGSELSCLMNPTVCWVANTRTIWTDLVVKHADDFNRANEQLDLYRTADVDSEMDYAAWSGIHAELDVALTRISEEGSQLARTASVKPGSIKYLWADAIANAVYEAHSPRARTWRSY
jgi:hypothetical protein